METTIQMEYNCLFWSFVLGGVLYGVYEIFRFLRRLLSNTFSVNFICDSFFMITAAFVFFTFTLGYSDGILRWYTIFAAFAAFIGCRLTIGMITGKFYDVLLIFLRKAILIIKNFFKNFLKTLLKNTGKMLYNITKIYRKIFFLKGKGDVFDGKKYDKKHRCKQKQLFRKN